MGAIERWLAANSENNIRRVLDENGVTFKKVRKAVRSHFADSNGVIRGDTLVTSADVEKALIAVLTARAERAARHKRLPISDIN